jgi:hypothetical protein
MLLFVQEEVLGAGHGTGILDTSDGIGKSHTGQVRVVSEALNVTASVGVAAKRTGNRSKKNINTLVLCLRAQGSTTVNPKVSAPTGGGSQASSESAVIPVESKTKGTILHAERSQSQARDGTNVSNTLLAHPTGVKVSTTRLAKQGRIKLALPTPVLRLTFSKRVRPVTNSLA